MDHIRRLLAEAIEEQAYSRTMLLRTVSPSDLPKAQGHIAGLEEAIGIIEDVFRKLLTSAA